ncbi:FK506-binding protein-like [Bombina bombina]|uniref:FK506-binding protein-like n=1 Tax=Bombina bombina TaxID=8345 RepID=UPI00235A6977|nr:FK506-binding protein-like [Bombina bombina]XP_053577963.1 FK506-binding protein-like [Bombina bombina]XP_053577964.1 FK506-binding protein-like [Bombina bombina]
METLDNLPHCKFLPWKSPDGRFTKTILEPGTGVDKPKESSFCQIFLDPLPSSTESCSKNTFSYPTGCWFQVELGEGETLQDLLVDQCLETMLCGEVCQVDTKLGSRFLLKLSNFENGKETWEMNTEEKLHRVTRDREKGGKAFREGNIEGAEIRYSRALRLLVCTPGEAEADWVPLLANMAACDLKKGRLREAEKRCTRALEKEPCHLKALYRRGMARAGMADWKGARTDFGEVLRLDPGNVGARREATRVKEKEKEEEARIGKALGKMFL